MIKYILIPGRVQSKTDGDVHHIGAAQLAQLYGVPMKQCTVESEETVAKDSGLISLYPDPTGKYDKVRKLETVKSDVL